MVDVVVIVVLHDIGGLIGVSKVDVLRYDVDVMVVVMEGISMI